MTHAPRAASSAAGWTKSSYSNGANGCVEVCRTEAGPVGLRDTKDRGAGPVLTVDPLSWRLFLDEVLRGLPSTNGALYVTVADELRDYPGRGEVHTRWHVTARDIGVALHFDEGEWRAFTLGAAHGEFGTPAALEPATG